MNDEAARVALQKADIENSGSEKKLILTNHTEVQPTGVPRHDD
jgi:hypothetical protein